MNAYVLCVHRVALSSFMVWYQSIICGNYSAGSVYSLVDPDPTKTFLILGRNTWHPFLIDSNCFCICSKNPLFSNLRNYDYKKRLLFDPGLRSGFQDLGWEIIPDRQHCIPIWKSRCCSYLCTWYCRRYYSADSGRFWSRSSEKTTLSRFEYSD